MRRRKYDPQQVLNFIIKYKTEHDGNSPSYREIMEAIPISSLSVVDYMLNRMQDEGLIMMDANRSIRIPGGEWRHVWLGGTREISKESN